MSGVNQMKRNRPAKMSIWDFIRIKYYRWGIWNFFAIRLPSWIRSILGYWYCGYCEKYHSALVFRYDITGGIGDDVCSLGKEPKTIAKKG